MSVNLTLREIEILQTMTLPGISTYKEAGTVLGLTGDDIKVRMSWIMEKLGANTRTHAVVIALKKGIISLEGMNIKNGLSDNGTY